ncbi:MAG: MBL fold metallo-hydrolase [Candidatus Sericytochromatia bacterium]
MKLKFWGVRGSIPTPWKDAMQVGGNTSCVQVLPRDHSLVILDAGTGLRLLGEDLTRQGQMPLHAHLLLSHNHWDHIQGFPFFGPAFQAGNALTIYGAASEGHRLPDILRGQMRAPYFPVNLDDMAAQLDFVELDETAFAIGDLQIRTCAFNHPGGVLGFRMEQEGQALVFATDMEYTEDNLDPRLIDFARGCDLLIYDSQYTPEELKNKTGWGHSTHIAAAHLALRAQVKVLMLYHHDPSHDDAMLRQMEAEARQIFPRSFLATEGLELDLAALPSA